MSLVVIFPPDWQFWSTLEVVTLPQAVLLSLNLDPNDVEYGMPPVDWTTLEHCAPDKDFSDRTAPIVGEHQAEYARRYRLATRGFSMAEGGGNVSVSLADFVAKATAWGWSLPPELTERRPAVNPAAPVTTPAVAQASAAQPSAAPARLLDVKAVAALVSRSVAWVHQKTADREFPQKVQKGRWLAEDVESWIKNDKL